ncbi:formylglycine-generating enzyme family protein [Paenibacillus glycanilyticus]|uniref:formylglycine-generating enzyme family protein n=1 Tax=Paenibacillus glycanilyticus TaxID=126569 RepID=UPI00203F42E8|nr:SUMF1/EgtB/PvdO family nonheme iron enzyme [Paenibacillus glycanilyticus]MCM3631150.1 formylglycine-generating enzyme family protein [Paenibacillus glycanilyticus]
MRKLVTCSLLAAMVVIGACSQGEPKQQTEAAAAVKQTAAKQPAEVGSKDGFVLVKGGAFVNTKSSYYGKALTLPDFYIGKYEVTQQEWVDVMGSNPSQFQGPKLPVEMVSWYDVIEYCNARSMREGLKPFYSIDKITKDPNNKSENDQLKWSVTINEGANGYRLPTDAEWEYAASGGQLSQSFTYSGSNNINEIAWYWRNAGEKYLDGDWTWPAIENNHDTTKLIGIKKPNELGLYDMTGNVREWCWDWYVGEDVPQGALRVVKGGGWIGDVGSAESAYRGKFEPNGFGPDQGFRLVRGE